MFVFYPRELTGWQKTASDRACRILREGFVVPELREGFVNQESFVEYPVQPGTSTRVLPVYFTTAPVWRVAEIL